MCCCNSPTPKYSPPKIPCILESVCILDNLAAYVTAAVYAKDEVIDSMASKIKHCHGAVIIEYPAQKDRVTKLFYLM